MPEPLLVQVGETLAQVEARLIKATLAAVGGNTEQAARLLGIHRTTVARKLRRWARAHA